MPCWPRRAADWSTSTRSWQAHLDEETRKYAAKLHQRRRRGLVVADPQGVDRSGG